MKQKYFVLLFLYIISVSVIYSQTVLSNSGVLVVSTGSQISVGAEGAIDQFTNSASGSIVNSGLINVNTDLDDSFVNDGIIENYTEINTGVLENNLTFTNDNIINAKSNFINNEDGVFSHNGFLNIKGNYTNDGVVNSNTGTTTFNQRDTDPSETIQNINGAGLIEFYNLVVNNNTSLGVLVENGIGLTIYEDLNLQEGDLRLEREAQLIQTKSGIDGNSPGAGNLLRDRLGGSSVYGYNYFSSPVNVGGTYSLSDVLYDGTDSSLNPFNPTPMRFTTTSEGGPSTLDVDGNVVTAAKIRTEFTYQFLNGDANDYDDWIEIDETTAMNPTEGYTMKGTNAAGVGQMYTFKGTPNNGDYFIPIDAGKSSLLGNPYASAFDSNLFLLSNYFVVNELYFWADGGSYNHTISEYYGGYATRNLSGGVGPSIIPGEIAGGGSASGIDPPGIYVAVGQGFFVEPVAPTSVYFSNFMRVFQMEKGNSESHFFKNPELKKGALAAKDEESKNSVIRLGYEDPEGFHRQLLLSFMPDSDANELFNPCYDARVSGEREDELLFLIEETPSEKYVIQGVGVFDESMVFPLSLTIAEEGIHTIMLDDVENFDNDIYIFDKVSGVNYDIRDENFSPTVAPGIYNDRFQLVFKQQGTLGSEDLSISNFKVYFDGDQNIVIDNKQNAVIEKLSIFNIVGQKVMEVDEKTLTNSKSYIPFNYGKNIYLVVIETLNGKESYKIIN